MHGHIEHEKKSLLGSVMKFLVPLIVTVGLCWVMFRSIDFDEMMSVIRHQCNFWWIGLTLTISVMSHVVRALRWHIQLKALNIKAPIWEVVLSVFGTYAVNMVFPRLGEVWRSGYIAQREKAPFSTVFGSMVAERVADLVTVLLLLLVTFFLASSSIVDYMSQNRETLHTIKALALSPWLWLFAAACAAVAWWLLRRKAAKDSVITKIQNFAKGLWKGFASILTMPGKGWWLLLTLLLWGCYFTQLYVAYYAFPFTTQTLAQYGIIAVLVPYVLSSVAMGVPSNGGIGPWQWAIMFALDIYGVSHTQSGAFANVVLGSQTLLIIVLGIFTFITIMITNKMQKSSR